MSEKEQNPFDEAIRRFQPVNESTQQFNAKLRQMGYSGELLNPENFNEEKRS